MDASNAFNSVNRQAALHNILRFCPPLAWILINTYQSPVRLIIPGSTSGGLVSTEGAYLVVKSKYVHAAARRSFAGTCIAVTTDGQRHLGAAIGPREYTTTYVTSKIKGWCDEIKRLSEIADIYPHVAYVAFTHGLFGPWSHENYP